MSSESPPIRCLHQHTLGDILRRTASRVPRKTAIRCGDVSWTYAEFDELCNRLAHGLMAQGVRIGDRVAILSRNSHAFAALRFALARIGAVIVPINFMLNADEIAFILRSSGATSLAVGPEFVDIGKAACARDTRVERLFWLPGEQPATAPQGMATFDDLLGDSASPPAVELDGSQLAQIVYTSGTESQPKGAMLTHQAVLWEYVSCVIEGEMTESDVMLHALPLYHCAQLDVFLGPAIYLGISSVIIGNATAG